MIDSIASAIPINVVLGGVFAIVGSVIGASMQHRYARKRDIKNTVYRPVFDETHRIGTYGELPYDPKAGSFKSVYRDLDAYQKFKAKRYIGGQMSLVEGSLRSLERLIPSYQQNIEEVFKDTEYANFDGDTKILSVNSTKELPHEFTTEEWVQFFYIPFVYSEGRDDLRENLEEYCWANLSEYSTTIENVEDEFLDNAWFALQEAERLHSSNLVDQTTYDVYMSARDRSRSISKDLGIDPLGVFDGDKDEDN